MPDLFLRPAVIAGETVPDDYQVFWSGFSIGRILKQPGVPIGRPNWHWGVAFPGRPQPSDHRGNCSDLDECKRRFKTVWAGIERNLSEADIEAARRIVELAANLLTVIELDPNCQQERVIDLADVGVANNRLSLAQL
jgi:hypothetical protein